MQPMITKSKFFCSENHFSGILFHQVRHMTKLEEINKTRNLNLKNIFNPKIYDFNNFTDAKKKLNLLRLLL